MIVQTIEPNPTKWPKFYRRAFLLTLPVSGPLLLLTILTFGLGVGLLCVVLFVFIIPIEWAVETWTGKRPIEWA